MLELLILWFLHGNRSSRVKNAPNAKGTFGRGRHADAEKVTAFNRLDYFQGTFRQCQSNGA